MPAWAVSWACSNRLLAWSEVSLPAAASACTCAAVAPKMPNCVNTSFAPAKTKIRSLSLKAVKRARWLAIWVFTGTVSAPPACPMPLPSVTREPPWP